MSNFNFRRKSLFIFILKEYRGEFIFGCLLIVLKYLAILVLGANPSDRLMCIRTLFVGMKAVFMQIKFIQSVSSSVKALGNVGHYQLYSDESI